MPKRAKAKRTPLKPGKPSVVKQKFKRSESWRYVRVKESWRASDGIDSKMRLKRKGHPSAPSIGHRVPKKIRGLHPSGLQETPVYRVEDLEAVDPSKQAVRIGHTVGVTKRVEILEKAKEQGILVLNPGRVKLVVEPKKPEETGS
jgi:large subunit ribosomal protein L32e